MTDAVTPLGAFAVAASAEEADAFRGATGLPLGGSSLPLTFPMRWLATQAVRDSLTGLVSEPEIVLVHESQSFDYEAPLQVGTLYTLSLKGRRKTDPDQLVVDGTIADPNGITLARIETILRLFSTADTP